MANSIQTLSERDRRLVAEWAVACVERVLWLFETENSSDERPRAAIARTRAFSLGELDAQSGIRQRFGGGGIKRGRLSPAAIAAARAAGQASAICHMGAHALGAAAYAVKAVSLSAPDRPEIAEEEIRWQLAQMTPEVAAALRSLPPIGEDRSGPLGPGLLATGQLAVIIRQFQARLTGTDTPFEAP